VPTAAISSAGMGAVNCVPLALACAKIKAEAPLAGCQLTPRHGAGAHCMKPNPLTVKVNAGPPAAAEAGERLMMVGAGLVTVNGSELDVPPTACTLTLAVPGATIRDAGMVAYNCVPAAVACPEINVVPPSAGCQFTPRHGVYGHCWKLAPLTVSVNAGPPAAVEAGERLEIVGPAPLTVNGTELDVPPAACTLTCTVPATAIRPAGIVTVNCVPPAFACPETTVKLPFAGCHVIPRHDDAAHWTKFVPLTVSVNAGPPAAVEAGDRLVMVGAPLLTVNESGLEVPPAACTLTCTVPAVAISAGVMATINCVPPALACAEIKLGTPLSGRQFTPRQGAAAHWMKLVPLTVSVNAGPPAVAEGGERLVTVGAGLLMVNGSELDVPNSACTVIFTVPATAISDAGMVAVNCVPLPLPCAEMTVEPPLAGCQLTARQGAAKHWKRLVPLTVSVNAGPPAVVEGGERLVMTGGCADAAPLMPSSSTANQIPGSAARHGFRRRSATAVEQEYISTRATSNPAQARHGSSHSATSTLSPGPNSILGLRGMIAQIPG